MRKVSTTALHNQDTTTIFDDVQFPIEYWFTTSSSTGVADRTNSAFTQSQGVTGNFALVNPNTGKVRVFCDFIVCMCICNTNLVLSHLSYFQGSWS